MLTFKESKDGIVVIMLFTRRLGTITKIGDSYGVNIDGARFDLQDTLAKAKTRVKMIELGELSDFVCNTKLKRREELS